MTIEAAGALVLRYSLALVIGWIGLMKFTGYEARGIEPMVERSPFMAWVYRFLSVQTFSDMLGVVEVTIAILIGLRHWSAKASALGRAAAVIMFLTTLSFLFSTSGWEPSLGGFPSLSALPGQFLLKDVVLLGAALNVPEAGVHRAIRSSKIGVTAEFSTGVDHAGLGNCSRLPPPFPPISELVTIDCPPDDYRVKSARTVSSNAALVGQVRRLVLRSPGEGGASP